jgi:hypothetical protein
MGGVDYDPSFMGLIFYQIMAFVMITLLPVIWTISIPVSLYTIFFRSSTAKDTATVIFLITMFPLGITLENCRILGEKFKKFWLGCGLLLQRLHSRPTRRVLGQSGVNLDDVELQRLISEFDPHAGPLPSYRKLYQYCPLKGLDEFRLLIVSPGSFNDSLKGELTTTCFSSIQRPAYDALSYTWADESGDSDRSREFLCEKDNSIIPITKNCEAAIRRLRFPNRKRWIWIDAICINQDSNSERTYQVSMMSRIYMSARHVVAYTGEGTDQTDKLFDWLNGLKTEDLNAFSRWDLDSLAGDVATTLDRFWDVGRERLLTLLRGSGASEQKISLSESELIELARVYFSRRWFKRVWVLQEVALPAIRNTTVICGMKTITAIRAFHALSLIYKDSSASMIRIFVLVRKNMKDLKRPHLLDVIIETRDREAGDARDKIFGVLSISNLLDRGRFPKLEADYSMTTAEVYVNYSTFFIQHHGPGFFLSLIKSPQKLVGLPSWAADWTVPWPNYNAVCGRDFAAESRSANDKDSKAIFSKENGYQVLTLVRSPILQGYFTRNGHLDGANDICIEGLEGLGKDEVLIEMYPGLAALLKKEDGYYTFAQVCPHALLEGGVKELVGRWSSVVVDAEGPEEQRGQDPRSCEYLGLVETFKIR